MNEQNSRSQLRREALQKGEPMPTFDDEPPAEASDLTALIERVKKGKPFLSAPDTIPLDVLSPERDEIVLALRRNRIVTSDHHFETATTVGNVPRYRLRIDGELTGYIDLDTAERLLGYGGGE